MREYLFALLAVCAVSSVIRVISPDGAMKKYIEMLCSVCVVCAVISPISYGISEIIADENYFYGFEYETVSYDEIYNSYLLDKNEELAENTLELELCERLATEKNALSVDLEIEENEADIEVRSVRVTLYGKAVALDPDTIKSFMLERVGYECEIIYEKSNE